MRHLGASLTAMLAVFFVSHAAHAMSAAATLVAYMDCSVDLSALADSDSDAPAKAPVAEAPVAEPPVAEAPVAEPPVVEATKEAPAPDVPADADMIYGAVDESEPRTPGTTERKDEPPTNGSAADDDGDDLNEPVEV